ncbi:MAG: hypothetical protein EP344_06030 [Bacteroidetes bacterium]|nr:MAG: hypothetical protein EP344_06030 [Bacteroidota bacterium]
MIVMLVRILIGLCSTLICMAFAVGVPAMPADSIPYRLGAPSRIINLESEDLREISGLSLSDTPGLFCAISDEKGEVLFVDSQGGGAIKRRVMFKEKGDFEGIEKVGKFLYAVKSNGDIYKVTRWQKNKPKIREYETRLSKTDDVEGLGYDKKRHALLVACKGDPEKPDIRPVYSFDLRTKQLSPKPVFTIDPKEVNALIPYDDDDKKHYFSSSGIAVHPLTGDVYVISTALKRMVVLDYRSGKIRYAARLNKKLLPQPEGIVFDELGNLYISSEAKKKGEAMLVCFDLVRSLP